MKKIVINNVIYTKVNYEEESEFEKAVVDNSSSIFGIHGIYIDIKKKIGMKTAACGIPDGYYFDLKFHDSPTLYIIENELVEHSLIRHISEQINRFIISAQFDKLNIRELLLKELSDSKYEYKLNDFYRESKYNNLHSLLDQAVLKNNIKTLVIIDEITDDLIKLQSIYANEALELLEFQSFTDGKTTIHLFDPFDDDLESIDKIVTKSGKKNIDFDRLDTIIVPAKKEGFNRAFIGKNCWYAIRISPSMLKRIKYIAAYQVKPISAITHYAEVDEIIKYVDDNGNETNKYKVIFKGTPKKLDNIVKLSKEYPNLAPQSPQYTSSDKLFDAKSLEELY